MFSEVLSPEERLALVKTVAFLAHADGAVSPEEAELVSIVGRNLGQDARKVLEEVPALRLEEILRAVSDARSKRVILQELVNLGYADGDYCEAKRSGIRRIAHILLVDEKTVSRIEDWVAEGIAWTRRGHDLLVKGA